MLEPKKPRPTFAVRNGLAPEPPQLKLGELSDEFRRLLYYALHKECTDRANLGASGRYFAPQLKALTRDLHVRYYGRDPDEYKNSPFQWAETFKNTIYRSSYDRLFSFVETVLRHPSCGPELREDVAAAFVDARSAYRVVDADTVVATATDEQAAAFAAAMQSAGDAGAHAARSHLKAAGSALAAGNWVDSVRESIHAVESIARLAAPDCTKLSDALSALEQAGHLHGGLRSAFAALYGYSSDERGIRHAKVFSDEAKVDEADAVFLLGACASFVSYVLARTGSLSTVS